MKEMSIVSLFVFHIEISGREIKDEQLENIEHISIVFIVSHFDKSGKYFKDLHPLNIPDKYSILFTFH